MRTLWKDRGLSITLFVLFVASLLGQSLAGWRHENDARMDHALPLLTLSDYLRTGAFLEVTMENWESEFLQMFVYVVFTVFLFQRGSSESKDPDSPNEPEAPMTAESPAPVRKGGWRLRLYENSMSLAFLSIFTITFLLHAVGGVAQYNEDRLLHGEPPITLAAYFMGNQFWFESLQNWQSEFLSLWSMVVMSIFLRQRGSPESKAVAAPHRQTGR